MRIGFCELHEGNFYPSLSFRLFDHVDELNHIRLFFSRTRVNAFSFCCLTGSVALAFFAAGALGIEFR